MKFSNNYRKTTWVSKVSSVNLEFLQMDSFVPGKGGTMWSTGPPILTLTSHRSNDIWYKVLAALSTVKQEAVKASNSPRDRKDGILMAKKTFEGRQLFSNNDIFLERCAFNRSDVGRRSVLIPLNASIRLRQNLNKILHTVMYTKDLWHTSRDLTVKYTDQPKIELVLLLVRLLVFTEMKLPTEG